MIYFFSSHEPTPAQEATVGDKLVQVKLMFDEERAEKQVAYYAQPGERIALTAPLWVMMMLVMKGYKVITFRNNKYARATGYYVCNGADEFCLQDGKIPWTFIKCPIDPKQQELKRLGTFQKGDLRKQTTSRIDDRQEIDPEVG